MSENFVTVMRYAVTITSVAAVLENILVLAVLAGTKRLRIKYYGFVYNLALADLCFAAFAISFPWAENSPVFALMMACYIVSILTIFAVAVNRYLALSLMPPSRYDAVVTGRRLFGVCVLIWAVSLLLNLLPVLTVSPGVMFWIYGLVRPLTVFIIWLITAIIYIVVFRKIKMYTPPMASNPGVTASAESIQAKTRVRQTRKLLITFVLILAACFVCWMPYSIVRVIAFAEPKDLESPIFFDAYWFAGWMYCISAMINPLIYWGRLDEFRQGFYALFCRCIVKTDFKEIELDETEQGKTVGETLL
ncbi:substance-K receptor-like [Patiria miniata]|uniref:G-protein coupled receptors family 1 profile domain-containing protein n=1 Tax=Patiria miniata TaxID=46514 RepID=A0A914A027_PATMI|nr:substance-K receptor-like [Patiria miniata]